MDDNFRKLDQEIPYEQGRAILVAFFENAINLYQSDPDKADDIAYSLAGLLSTRFAQSLSDSDPLLELLLLASELELPLEQRSAGSTWELFEQKVSALNQK